MLEIVGEAMSRNNIHYVLCKSKIKDFESGGAIEVFRSSPYINVLLLPLAYGAEGLDLIVASHVFLLEPLLNMHQEMQAVNRIYRIGQTKRTMIHKYVIHQTVEERIVEYQHLAAAMEDPAEDSCGIVAKGLKRDDGSLTLDDAAFIMMHDV